MLLLRAKTATINNITFFADDSDENQFWYLPGDIHIAQKSGEPVFSLIKYTGDASDPQGVTSTSRSIRRSTKRCSTAPSTTTCVN